MPQYMTPAQVESAQTACENYGVPFDSKAWFHSFDLPTGWVAGNVAGVVIGISPDGRRAS